jgi:hypothetical protein
MREAEWIAPKPRNAFFKDSYRARLMAAKASRIKGNIQKWEQAVANATPPFTQCQHLIRKFGGIVPFAVAVGVHPDEIIQFWLVSPLAKQSSLAKVKNALHMPTGGFVPSAYLPRLLATARSFGILILPQDLYPDFSTETSKDYSRWIKTIKKSEKMSEFEHVLASLHQA